MINFPEERKFVSENIAGWHPGFIVRSIEKDNMVYAIPMTSKERFPNDNIYTMYNNLTEANSYFLIFLAQPIDFEDVSNYMCTCTGEIASVVLNRLNEFLIKPYLDTKLRNIDSKLKEISNKMESMEKIESKLDSIVSNFSKFSSIEGKFKKIFEILASEDIDTTKEVIQEVETEEPKDDSIISYVSSNKFIEDSKTILKREVICKPIITNKPNIFEEVDNTEEEEPPKQNKEVFVTPKSRNWDLKTKFQFIKDYKYGVSKYHDRNSINFINYTKHLGEKYGIEYKKLSSSKNMSTIEIKFKNVAYRLRKEGYLDINNNLTESAFEELSSPNPTERVKLEVNKNDTIYDSYEGLNKEQCEQFIKDYEYISAGLDTKTRNKMLTDICEKYGFNHYRGVGKRYLKVKKLLDNNLIK